MTPGEHRDLLARARRDAVYRTIAFAALGAPLALMLALSFAYSPDDIASGRVALSPTCWSVRLFHRPCPTCGMTRGFAAISHGQVRRSFSYNRFAAPFYVACWGAMLFGLGGAVRSGWQLRQLARHHEATHS